MTRRRASWPWAAGVWMWAVAATASAQGEAPQIAVVSDGASDTYSRLTHELSAELRALFGGRYPDLALPEAPTHPADFTLEGARTQLQRALSDPAVDLVVGLGVDVGRLVGAMEKLPKPVFLPFAQAELQGLPREGAKSGRKNLNYLTGLVDLDRDLRRFREVIRRDRVVLVVDGHIVDSIDDLASKVQGWAGDSMQVSLVPAGETAASILDALPPDAEAVYLGVLVRLPDSEIDPLLRGLEERKLPSYASSGRAWVERGAFVSLVSDDEEKRRLRKLALNIDEALAGEDPADMPTTFERRAHLAINMRTARRIDVWPRFELMTEAELLGEDQGSRGQTLTLQDAVHEALDANRDFAARRVDIEIARQQYRGSKGEMAPSIDGAMNFEWIPKAAVFPILNSEAALDVGAQAQQILYSPAVVGGLRSRRHSVDASEQGVRTAKLDLIELAAVAYLDVLRARTAEDINRDFLARVRQNLSMAEVRVEIGASGRQDVFRWQIEIADARVNVLSAAAIRRKAEIQLNRIRNHPLEEPMQTVEPMNTEGGIGLDPRVGELVNDPWSFEVLREFLAKQAVELSPEVAQLEASIQAQEEAFKARRARLFLPDITAHASVTRFLGRWGRGADQGPIMPGQPSRQDFRWSLGASARMNIFSMTRYAELDENRARVLQLQGQRRAAAQAVEQRVRSTAQDASVSSSAMDLRKDAAEAAHQNLELVTDAYRQGTVNIITLVDAQNQSLASELRAANAVYDFLIDLVHVERAAGRFSFMQPESERREQRQELERFYLKRRAADRSTGEETTP